jgi:hypothetical protein
MRIPEILEELTSCILGVEKGIIEAVTEKLLC